MENELDRIAERIKAFCAARDWDKFHNPKNLSMAVAIEAAELMEIFQWLTLEESAAAALSQSAKRKVREETADILIYAIRISQVVGFDLLKAIEEKIELNELKYPVEKIKGKAGFDSDPN